MGRRRTSTTRSAMSWSRAESRIATARANPADVVVRYQCPICGGEHAREEHGLARPRSRRSGLAAGGTVSGAASPVLFSGNRCADANSLWHVVDSNGSKHRD